MSSLCIGGVCIPYSALLPALLVCLRWIAARLANYGLLPDFVARRLGVVASDKNNKSADGCVGGCCPVAARGESVLASTASSSDNDGGTTKGEVEHVDSLDRYRQIFASSQNSTLFVKFTADWCKPCKAIQPEYASLASKYNSAKFITVDVDGDDCDALSSELRVAMMPTFVCFGRGREGGRMSGGNSEDRLREWVGEMMDS